MSNPISEKAVALFVYSEAIEILEREVEAIWKDLEKVEAGDTWRALTERAIRINFAKNQLKALERGEK